MIAGLLLFLSTGLTLADPAPAQGDGDDEGPLADVADEASGGQGELARLPPASARWAVAATVVAHHFFAADLDDGGDLAAAVRAAVAPPFRAGYRGVRCRGVSLSWPGRSRSPS